MSFMEYVKLSLSSSIVDQNSRQAVLEETKSNFSVCPRIIGYLSR